jgi:dTDP-4-dehydrorhamnose 3,5-epimerase
VKFAASQLQGVYIVEIEPVEDDRGFFARTWCAREFAANGLSIERAQFSVSFNRRKGTLRGMHYQAAPHEEVKIVQCVAGAIYDVVVDLRRDSTTYAEWFGIELSARNHTMLYIPEGFAHGFQTLTDEAEVGYQISEFFEPEYARGFRWDDPAVGIQWPLSVTAISERDRHLPTFQDR